MHGNVWEWVQDCWNDVYGANTPSDGKPALKGDCKGRVLRGGSWEDGAADVRAAARVASATTDRSWSGGIRVAGEAEPISPNSSFRTERPQDAQIRNPAALRPKLRGRLSSTLMRRWEGPLCRGIRLP